MVLKQFLQNLNFEIFSLLQFLFVVISAFKRAYVGVWQLASLMDSVPMFVQVSLSNDAFFLQLVSCLSLLQKKFIEHSLNINRK
jgi:hypothetical protein